MDNDDRLLWLLPLRLEPLAFRRVEEDISLPMVVMGGGFSLELALERT